MAFRQGQSDKPGSENTGKAAKASARKEVVRKKEIRTRREPARTEHSSGGGTSDEGSSEATIDSTSSAATNVEAEGSADSQASDTGDQLSRKELVQKAIGKIEKELGEEKVISRTTIGNLVQLLKLERDLIAEEEVPHEIRVVWQETNGESTSEE